MRVGGREICEWVGGRCVRVGGREMRGREMRRREMRREGDEEEERCVRG